MIVFKMWFSEEKVSSYRKAELTWHGWFLFGFIPLYIKMVSRRES